MVNWENRWQTGQTGWDLGAASPPLCAYADQIPVPNRDIRVLIPGCGNGYEAIYLLGQGFSNVTMLDIAPTAIAKITQRLQDAVPDWATKLQLVCQDFFDFQGEYELILEQTFFCALEPGLRPKYVEKMHALLAPGGKLTGVLFNKDFEGGPPFGGSTGEYRKLFEPFFELKTMAPCYNSIAPRAGAEVFVILEKRKG
jgi:SAM-dependent methyltransferase